MAKYDFFIAGRWRNKQSIEEVLAVVRGAGKSAHCFTEHPHDRDEAALTSGSAEEPTQDDPLVRRIFEEDMQALRDSELFLLVLPAGLSAHMELGAAYGMGKRCLGVGQLEKTESLYCMFEKVFANLDELKQWLEANNG
ncbi:MAG TPA: hypothetical protein VLF69_05495 [Candidatus Saccharimonadales bacterium]|nr:hypothetical protein [Candidatus Saccharimonadales bacterium]